MAMDADIPDPVSPSKREVEEKEMTSEPSNTPVNEGPQAEKKKIESWLSQPPEIIDILRKTEINDIEVANVNVINKGNVEAIEGEYFSESSSVADGKSSKYAEEDQMNSKEELSGGQEEKGSLMTAPNIVVEGGYCQNEGVIGQTPDLTEGSSAAIESLREVSNKHANMDNASSTMTASIEQDLREINFKVEDEKSNAPSNSVGMEMDPGTIQPTREATESREGDKDNLGSSLMTGPMEETSSAKAGPDVGGNLEENSSIACQETVELSEKMTEVTSIEDNVQNKNLMSSFISKMEEICPQKEENLETPQKESETSLKETVKEAQYEADDKNKIVEDIDTAASNPCTTGEGDEIPEPKAEKLRDSTGRESEDLTPEVLAIKCEDEGVLVVADEDNIVAEEQDKAETSTQEEQSSHSFMQEIEPANANLGSPWDVGCKEIETSPPNKYAEMLTNIEEKKLVRSSEEIFGETRKEETIADEINTEIQEAKTLATVDLDNNGNELLVTHPPVEDDEVQVGGEKQDQVHMSESDNIQEAFEIPKEEEKHVNETYEASKSPESTILEHTPTERALNKEVTSTRNEMDMDMDMEKGCEVNTELKEVNAETNIKDKMEQKGDDNERSTTEEDIPVKRRTHLPTGEEEYHHDHEEKIRTDSCQEASPEMDSGDQSCGTSNEINYINDQTINEEAIQAYEDPKIADGDEDAGKEINNEEHALAYSPESTGEHAEKGSRGEETEAKTCKPEIEEELKYTSEGEGITKQAQEEENRVQDWSTVSAGEELDTESSKDDQKMTKMAKEEVLETLQRADGSANIGIHSTDEDNTMKENFAACGGEEAKKECSFDEDKEGKETDTAASDGHDTSGTSITLEESAMTDLPSSYVQEEEVEESLKEDRRDAMKSENEEWNSNIECIERDFNATHSTDERRDQDLKDEAEPNQGLDTRSITGSSEETAQNQSNLNLVENSSVPEMIDKDAKREREKEDSKDKVVAEETSLTEAEEEVDSSNLNCEEKGQVTTETGSNGMDITDIIAKPAEISILGDNDDMEIPKGREDGEEAAAEKRQPEETNGNSDILSQIEDQTGIATVETSLGDISDQNLLESSRMSSEEHNLVTEVSETTSEAPEKDKTLYAKEETPSAAETTEEDIVEKDDESKNQKNDTNMRSTDIEKDITVDDAWAKDQELHAPPELNNEKNVSEPDVELLKRVNTSVEIEKAPVEQPTFSTRTENKRDVEDKEMTSKLSNVTVNNVSLEEKENAESWLRRHPEILKILETENMQGAHNLEVANMEVVNKGNVGTTEGERFIKSTSVPGGKLTTDTEDNQLNTKDEMSGFQEEGDVEKARMITDKNIIVEASSGQNEGVLVQIPDLTEGSSMDSEILIEVCKKEEIVENVLSTKTTSFEQDLKETSLEGEDKKSNTSSNTMGLEMDPETIQPSKDVEKEKNKGEEMLCDSIRDIRMSNETASQDNRKAEEPTKTNVGAKDKLGSALVTESMEEASFAKMGPEISDNLEESSRMTYEEESQETGTLSDKVKGVASIEDEVQHKNLESSYVKKVEDVFLLKVDNLEISKGKCATEMKDIDKERQKEAEYQNKILENPITADSNLSKTKDNENLEQNADAFMKPEERMTRENEDATPMEALTVECKPGDLVEPGEDNVVAEEQGRNETSKDGEHSEQRLMQNTEPAKANLGSPSAVASEFETTSPNKYTEMITNIGVDRPVASPEEILGETRKDETIIDDDVDKKEITEAKNLSVVDLGEKTGSAEVKIPNNSGNEVYITHPPMEEAVLEGDEKHNDVSMLESGDQIHEASASEVPKEEEKPTNDTYEASKLPEYGILEHKSNEGAVNIEATSTRSAEERPVESPEETLGETKKDETRIADDINKNDIAEAKNLTTVDLDEKIRSAEGKIPINSGNEVYVTYPPVEETVPEGGEKQNEVSMLESGDRVHEPSSEVPKEEEKHANDAYEASKSPESSILEHISTDGTVNMEEISTIRAMDNIKLETGCEMKSEEKLKELNAEENINEVIEHKETASDTKFQIATKSDDNEKSTTEEGVPVNKSIPSCTAKEEFHDDQENKNKPKSSQEASHELDSGDQSMNDQITNEEVHEDPKKADRSEDTEELMEHQEPTIADHSSGPTGEYSTKCSQENEADAKMHRAEIGEELDTTCEGEGIEKQVQAEINRVQDWSTVSSVEELDAESSKENAEITKVSKQEVVEVLQTSNFSANTGLQTKEEDETAKDNFVACSAEETKDECSYDEEKEEKEPDTAALDSSHGGQDFAEQNVRNSVRNEFAESFDEKIVQEISQEDEASNEYGTAPESMTTRKCSMTDLASSSIEEENVEESLTENKGDEMRSEKEVWNSNIESTKQVLDPACSTEEREARALKDEAEPNEGLIAQNITVSSEEETNEKDNNLDLVENSSPVKEIKEVVLEKEESNITVAAEETSLTEAEEKHTRLEDNSTLIFEEKGLVTTEASEMGSNGIELIPNDMEIPTAIKHEPDEQAEKTELEGNNETGDTLSKSQDQREVATVETSLDGVSIQTLQSSSTLSLEEHNLVTPEVGETAGEVPDIDETLYGKAETPLVEETIEVEIRENKDESTYPKNDNNMGSIDVEKDRENDDAWVEDRDLYTAPEPGVELLKRESNSEVANCSEISKLETVEQQKSLEKHKSEYKMAINETSEGVEVYGECVDKEKAILEQENSVKNLEGSSKESDKIEKAPVEFEAETHGASETRSIGPLKEKNLQTVEHKEKTTRSVTESMPEDKDNRRFPETNPANTEEESHDDEYRTIDSTKEQISGQDIQEGKMTKEEMEPKIKTQKEINETQDATLTEKIFMEIERASESEIIEGQITEEESYTKEPLKIPVADETVNEVTDMDRTPIQSIEATASNENTEMMESKIAQDLNEESEASPRKKVLEGKIKKIEKPVDVSSLVSEGSEEKITVENLDDTELCDETDIAPTMITDLTSRGEVRLNDEPVKAIDTSSDAGSIQTTKNADASQLDTKVDSVKLEETSSIGSQLLEHEQERADNTSVNAEKSDANDVEVEETKFPGAVPESKDQRAKEIHETGTSLPLGETCTDDIEKQIREVPEALSEAINQGVEATSEDDEIIAPAVATEETSLGKFQQDDEHMKALDTHSGVENPETTETADASQQDAEAESMNLEENSFMVAHFPIHEDEKLDNKDLPVDKSDANDAEVEETKIPDTKPGSEDQSVKEIHVTGSTPTMGEADKNEIGKQIREVPRALSEALNQGVEAICEDEISVPAVATEVTNLGEVQQDDEHVKALDTRSGGENPKTTESADARQQDAEADSMKPEETSTVVSHLSIHEDEKVDNEDTPVEKSDATDVEVEETKIPDAETESGDQSVKETHVTGSSPTMGEADTDEIEKQIREVPQALSEALNQGFEAVSEDEISAPAVVMEVTSLGKVQQEDEHMKALDTRSGPENPEITETADTSQQDAEVDSMKLEETSMMVSQLPIHEHEKADDENITGEKSDANDVEAEETKTPETVPESEDQIIKEIYETGTSLTVEDADTNEIEKQIREVPEVLLEPINQCVDAARDDEITPAQTLRAEKQEEQLQATSSGLLSKEQESETTTTIKKESTDKDGTEVGNLKLQENSGMVFQLPTTECDSANTAIAEKSDAVEVELEETKTLDAVSVSKLQGFEEIHENRTSPAAENTETDKIEEEIKEVTENMSDPIYQGVDTAADGRNLDHPLPVGNIEDPIHVSSSALFSNKLDWETRATIETIEDKSKKKDETEIEKSELEEGTDMLSKFPTTEHEICNVSATIGKKGADEIQAEEANITAAILESKGDGVEEINEIRSHSPGEKTQDEVKEETKGVPEKISEPTKKDETQLNRNVAGYVAASTTEKPCSKDEGQRELEVSNFELKVQNDGQNRSPDEENAALEKASTDSLTESEKRHIQCSSQETSTEEDIIYSKNSNKDADNFPPRPAVKELLTGEVVEKSKEASNLEFEKNGKVLLESVYAINSPEAPPITEGLEVTKEQLKEATTELRDGENDSEETTKEAEAIKTCPSKEEILEEKQVSRNSQPISPWEETTTKTNQEDELRAEDYPGESRNITFETPRNEIENDVVFEASEESGAAKETITAEYRTFEGPFQVSVGDGMANVNPPEEAKDGKNIEKAPNQPDFEKQGDETNFRETAKEATAQTKESKSSEVSLVGHEDRTGDNDEETVISKDERLQNTELVVPPVTKNSGSLVDTQKLEDTCLEPACEGSGVTEDLDEKRHDCTSQPSISSSTAVSQVADTESELSVDTKQHDFMSDTQTTEAVNVLEEGNNIHLEEHTKDKEPVELSTTGDERKLDEAKIQRTKTANEEEETQQENEKPNVLSPIKGSGTEVSCGKVITDISEVNEITKDTRGLDKSSLAMSNEQVASETDQSESIETTNSIASKDVSLMQHDATARTFQSIDVEDLKAGYTSGSDPEAKGVECGQQKRTGEESEEKIEESMMEPGNLSLSNLLQRSAKGTLQAVEDLTEERGLTGNKEEPQTETAELVRVAEAKSEGKQEEEDEHKREDLGSDAPVMVEASRDMDVKIPHKKSHNILSGVGSKVKHSLAKVKKAITGKSSHPKPPLQYS